MDKSLPLPDPALSRPSACPGLLRIVQALDGGICRIKLLGGQLRADQARAIARAAERHASGVLELTNRGNLQLRGVRPEQAQALIDDLLAASLGPDGARDLAAADAVRNLMLSPAAGFDPAALLDTRPLAQALLALLQSDPRLHRLSAKFAVQLDGGERLAMLDHPHDLWITALQGGPAPLFGFGLAGCPANQPPLAAVTGEQLVALVHQVLLTFLALAGPQQTRMRHLLSQLSTDDFIRQVQSRLSFPLLRDPAVTTWRRVPGPAWAHLGIQPQADPAFCQVGGQPPLGRLDSHLLHRLAELAEQQGDGSLHLTPWQSLLLPQVPQARAAEVLSQLENLGLLCHPDLPLTRLIACSGARDCAKGLADTKADARRLADLLATRHLPSSIHLSGCQRSCAAAHPAAFTLLAVAAGRYDLYRRAPAQPGFGHPLGHHLSLEEASLLLAAAPELDTDR
ncbi:MAG: precorrin-3B synthase [Pseudomonas sp.]|uniref:precorrin-3B synthase n=1 Tax=Pseudomonas sp. TaxID=306 RepID=UPI003397A771